MANQNNPRPPGDDDENDVNHRARSYGDEPDFEHDDDFASVLDDLEDDLNDDGLDDYDDDLEDDLDDDLDDDIEDDHEDNVDLAHLAEHFQGDDFRIVSLNELASLDDIAEEGFSLDAPTLTLEEVLYQLVREPEEIAPNELAVFSDLSRFDAEETRRMWPHIPLMRRRSIVSSVTELFADGVDLDFGTFLRIAVDDPDVVVQRFAVIGLAEEGASVDLLGRYVQLLQSAEDVELRAAAAAALGSYILEGELEELDAAMAMRAEQVLMAVLADAREPAVVKSRALESIAYSGELGVRQLIEDAYYSPDESRRLSALVAMGRSADVRWRRLARAELTNPDPAMRARAAFACGELEAKSALPELLKLLVDKDQAVRLAAMFALSHIGGAQARAALQTIYETGDDVESYAAEQALEELDFYTSVQAASTPMFDESEAADDEWDPISDWDEDEEDQEDDDLGQYE
jgi:HEAT repeat protein